MIDAGQEVRAKGVGGGCVVEIHRGCANQSCPQRNGHRSADAEELGREWLKRVGLEDFGDHFPYQLSGGMRKRVAMAQNWIAGPDILLMDEPFSALDIHTRQRMEGEILNLWSGTNKTVLFVTHDLEEAIALSDEVLVLSAGPASRLVGRYPVDLPRPRNLIDIRTEPRFADLYRAIWTDLREEVLRSYAGPPSRPAGGPRQRH